MMKAMTPDDGYDTDAAPLLPPPVVTTVLDVVPPAWAWGSLLPAAGYGRCYACRRPWWACLPREVDYDAPGGLPNSRHFALCRHCWDRADVEYRVIAHRWTVVMACPNWSPDELTRIEIMVRGISEFDTY